LTENDSRTMSPSRFTAKKKQTTKILGEEQFTNYGKPKAPTNFFSITPLFNLLALRNKLNPKSILMECLFFSPQFFCIAFIYLHLYLKSVYLSKKGKYYFSNWIEENFMTTNKKSNVISIGDHIYPLDKTLSVWY
jgi:hypothetical protein